MRDGIVVLDLRTGASRVVRSRHSAGSWLPAGKHVLMPGYELAVSDGSRRPAPYSRGVGYTPHGTPLSLERSNEGEALLVEWSGRTRRVRTVVPGLRPPRLPLTPAMVESGRTISCRRLSPVSASSTMVAQLDVRGERRRLVAADSRTGETAGELTWGSDRFPLHKEVWLDDETLLIATRPWFLVWRRATDEVFRVTDARALAPAAYWEISLAPGALSRPQPAM